MSYHHLLRIPFVILLNEVFKHGFGYSNWVGKVYFVNSGFDNCTLSQIEVVESTQYYEAIFLIFFERIVSCLIFCLMLCLFVVPIRYLHLVYFYAIYINIVTFSYWLNIKTLKDVYGKYEIFTTDVLKKDTGWDVAELLCPFTQITYCLHILFPRVVLQFCPSLLLYFLQRDITNSSIHKVYSFNFIVPTIIMVFLPGTRRNKFLNTLTLLSTLLPLFIMLKTLCLNLFTITNLICSKYHSIRESIKISTLLNLVMNVVDVLNEEWKSLKMSIVLQIFWLIQLLQQFQYLITIMKIQNETLVGAVNNLLLGEYNTFAAVFGVTSFVSCIFHHLETFFQWVILTDDDDLDDKSPGTISAMLFYILSMQNEPTDLDPEKRFIRLNRNVCVICAAMIHFIHDLINPLIMSLNASYNSSLKIHFCALLVNGFGLVYSTFLLKYLWSQNYSSFELIAVSSLNITIIIKVFTLLVINTLLLIESNRTTYWEELDDYVYYIKSFGNTVEFCFNIFLVLNGTYAIAFKSDGAIQTFMMCINLFMHAYSFIWCDARNGWRKFIERRTAMRKIESLSDATSVKLAELNDVCAICHQNMVSAKITRCNHCFHSVCLLRKSLHINDEDQCPLCQQNMYRARK